MNKQLSLLAAALLLMQAPAWSADMAAHTEHDMSTMQSEDTKKDDMSDMDHSQMKGMDHSQMQGMDHSQMKGMDHSQMKGMDQSQMKGMDQSQMKGMDHSQMKGMDHSQMKGMDHSQMKGMDHNGMQHDKVPAMQNKSPAAMTGMQSKSMPTSEDGEMKMAPMQGGSAPPDARDPNAYADGYEPNGMPPMGDQHNFGSLLVEKLEAVRTTDNTSAAYDVKAWFGRDYDRAVLKAEGDIDKGKLQDARTEILWGHAIAPYWDTQLGLRYDSGVGPGRGWLAFGVEGLSPYWFDVEATAYVGSDSRTALRLAASYDILFTQKLILTPQIEANFYGKDDAERDIGSGLSDITSGVRLRYEIRRQLAPYIGLEWENKFGGSADYARLAGEKSNEARLVAGVRFWF